MVIKFTKKEKKYFSSEKKQELENRKGKPMPLSNFFNPPKQVEEVDNNKLKSKADIINSLKINTQIQILNGEQCIRYSNVPTILLDMKPPKDYHQKTQNQRFAMWFKLEDKEYMNVAKQLKPHLKELTFWLEKEDEEKLKEFLDGKK